MYIHHIYTIYTPSTPLNTLHTPSIRLKNNLLNRYLTQGASKAEGPNADPKVVEAVAAIQAGLSDEHMKVMNLSHDWLRTFLPHVIAKINRFKFGLLSAEDLNRALDLDPHIGRNRRLLAVR